MPSDVYPAKTTDTRPSIARNIGSSSLRFVPEAYSFKYPLNGELTPNGIVLLEPSKLSTEGRLYLQHVYHLQHHTQSMAEHLAQSFVDLSNIVLTPQRIAKLALYRRIGGFDVRALVVL